jgi:predicted TIM-barrel fold metal-dependent hydrolase
MLGSNYPVERIVKPYEDIWADYFKYFEPFSAAEREMLFWRNAATTYRLRL